uniref:SCP domain-containing protein n=1 Tax=Glossina brevipalpis TaxID=37001 RepID=A0A1A9X3D0_9MUSC
MLYAYEYCKPETLKQICKPNVEHSHCGAPEGKSEYPAEEMAPLLPITNKVKRYFLDLHNGWRDKVASGQEVGKGGQNFQIGTRMREVIWDNELHYLAAFHVKRGKKYVEKCVSSKRLNYVSQIYGFKGGQEMPDNVFDIINETFSKVYSNKVKIKDPSTMAANCTADVWGAGAKDFLRIIQERLSRIGCAFGLGYNCVHSPGNVFRFCNYIVCNYDFDTKYFEINYQPGDKAASDCTEWGATQSTKWPHLCGNTGKVFRYLSPWPNMPFGLA